MSRDAGWTAPADPAPDDQQVSRDRDRPAAHRRTRNHPSASHAANPTERPGCDPSRGSSRMLMVGCAGEPVVSEGCSSHAPSSQRPSATKTAAHPAAPPRRMGAASAGGPGAAYHALATPRPRARRPRPSPATRTGPARQRPPSTAAPRSPTPGWGEPAPTGQPTRARRSVRLQGAAREPGPGQAPPPPSTGPARRPADHRRVAPRLRRAGGSRPPGRAAPSRRPGQQGRARPPIIPGRHQVARRRDSRAAPGVGRSRGCR